MREQVRKSLWMMAMSAMSTMYGAAQSPAAPTVPTFGETQKTATFADVVHPAQHPELTLIGPRQVWRFYNMEGVKNMGEGQTIALIGSHHDPVIERDLAVFSQRFGLPLCSVKSGCFRQIDIPDTAHAGATDSGAYTYVEESMDVEWAHAIAPKAKLMLVEARGAPGRTFWPAWTRPLRTGRRWCRCRWPSRSGPTIGRCIWTGTGTFWTRVRAMWRRAATMRIRRSGGLVAGCGGRGRDDDQDG